MAFLLTIYKFNQVIFINPANLVNTRPSSFLLFFKLQLCNFAALSIWPEKYFASNLTRTNYYQFNPIYIWLAFSQCCLVVTKVKKM